LILIQRHHFTRAFHLAFGVHIFFWQNLQTIDQETRLRGIWLRFGRAE
jgi:hypothetical protein